MDACTRGLVQGRNFPFVMTSACVTREGGGGARGAVDGSMCVPIMVQQKGKGTRRTMPNQYRPPALTSWGVGNASSSYQSALVTGRRPIVPGQHGTMEVGVINCRSRGQRLGSVGGTHTQLRTQQTHSHVHNAQNSRPPPPLIFLRIDAVVPLPPPRAPSLGPSRSRASKQPPPPPPTPPS